MSSIINKLLGKDDDKHHGTHAHSQDVKCSSGTCSTTTTTGGEACGTKCDSKNINTCAGSSIQGEGRTVDGVNIKSTVTSDTSSTVQLANQQKLTELVSRLGATHSQIDEYARQQTEKINDEIQREIDQVVARTRQQQDELLRKANEHTAQIDSEYRARLQKMVEEVDAAKAKRIAEIESDLNKQQADILTSARTEIDQLNQKAANLKIGVLQQAQAKAASDANAITAEASHLGQASTVHQSTGTTTIKTEVAAATTSRDAGSATVTTENKIHEAARVQSHETRHN